MLWKTSGCVCGCVKRCVFLKDEIVRRKWDSWLGEGRMEEPWVGTICGCTDVDGGKTFDGVGHAIECGDVFGDATTVHDFVPCERHE